LGEATAHCALVSGIGQLPRNTRQPAAVTLCPEIRSNCGMISVITGCTPEPERTLSSDENTVLGAAAINRKQSTVATIIVTRDPRIIGCSAQDGKNWQNQNSAMNLGIEANYQAADVRYGSLATKPFSVRADQCPLLLQ
jgi:hypothetical protein